ncbi:MAG: hypothetical protein GY754_07505 [bacterium]|nr:hypothetical protein [bacterium]
MDMQSKTFSISNRHGKTIHAVFDFVDMKPGKPVILVPSQYERVMRDNIVVSLYLTANGFNVLRYDLTDHVGLSCGQHEDFQLSTSYFDFHEILDYVRNSKEFFHEYAGIGVVGVSLSARVLFKYFAENNVSDIDLLISLVGVLDVTETVHNTCGTDWLNKYKNGDRHEGSFSIIDHEVSFLSFCSDAWEKSYATLDTTITDIKKITTPMVLIISEKDDWVPFEQYELVFSDEITTVKEKFVIPDASHKFYKNPHAAQTAMLQIVTSFSRYLSNIDLCPEDIYKPDFEEILSYIKLERKRELEAL